MQIAESIVRVVDDFELIQDPVNDTPTRVE
jgi:hypothetical protein